MKVVMCDNLKSTKYRCKVVMCDNLKAQNIDVKL